MNPDAGPGDDDDGTHRGPSPRLIAALLLACAGFVLVGLAAAWLHDGPLFAPYRDALARRFWGGGEPPAQLGGVLALLFGVTGGTVAGKWVMHAAIIAFAVRAGERWAWRASVAGLASWFVVDSAVSLWRDAAFNVWMINLVPVVALAPLLLRARGGCARPAAAPPPWRWWSRWLVAASALSVVAGLGIAVGVDTPLFAPWFHGLDQAHFAGAGVPDGARALCRFFFGPIGGATVGTFVLTGAAAWYGRGQRWVTVAIAASLLTWFVVDSACSLARGGAFNVLLVNLPTMVLFAPALLGAALARK